MIALLPFLVVATVSGSTPQTIPLQVQAADGYAGNPSTLVKPLRQDLTRLDVALDDQGLATLHLAGSGDGPTLGPIDLGWWIPRIPRLAKGEPTLTRVALMQREFNRNETRFEGVAGCDGVKLANNCLKRGLWEIMLDKKTESGTGLQMHAWFDFPRPLYAELFQKLNGTAYEPLSAGLDAYGAFGGFELPLAKLRVVDAETNAPGVSVDLDSARPIFSEQKRKAHLLLGTFTKLGDFVDPAKQPVKTAKFNEPGRYDANDPVSFDLTWLAKPVSATWRTVHGVQAKEARLDELEVRFANGHRLVVAADGLAKLAPREKPPEADKDCLRITFGISTPDIYASAAEREKEQASPRDDYLFLLDAKGTHLDNHALGIDRVFAWRDATNLHLDLVGYERIAIIADLRIATQPH